MDSLEERHHVEMEFFPKMTREQREEKQGDTPISRDSRAQ